MFVTSRFITPACQAADGLAMWGLFLGGRVLEVLMHAHPPGATRPRARARTWVRFSGQALADLRRACRTLGATRSTAHAIDVHPGRQGPGLVQGPGSAFQGKPWRTWRLLLVSCERELRLVRPGLPAGSPDKVWSRVARDAHQALASRLASRAVVRRGSRAGSSCSSQRLRVMRVWTRGGRSWVGKSGGQWRGWAWVSR